MAQSKTLIFIPTYNEAENAPRLFQQIQMLHPDADFLFLDDNSPDGTGKILDAIAEEHRQVNVIHRKEKSGIGSAHKAGIQWAYDQGYELLLTMDCDFTHSPEYIFDFLHNRSRADVIVGSRYLKKDSLATWSLFRKSLTRLGHFFTSELLDMPYDASNAFRLYNLQSIDRHLFSLVQSEGYAFFFESLFILHVNGKKVFEIPIGLPSRAHGDSKMTWKDGMESARLMLSLYGRKLFNSQSLRLK